MRGESVIEHHYIKVQPVSVVGEVVHRNPGFLTIGPVAMAENDRLVRVGGRNIPAMHDSAAVGGREDDILVLQVLG
ncbi:hypothetical protein D3C76_1042620 [compost metagenome]